MDCSKLIQLTRDRPKLLMLVLAPTNQQMILCKAPLIYSHYIEFISSVRLKCSSVNGIHNLF